MELNRGKSLNQSTTNLMSSKPDVSGVLCGYIGPILSATRSSTARLTQNPSPLKYNKEDGDGSATFYGKRQIPSPELLSDGPLMVEEKEAVPRKLGGGR